MAFRLEFPVRRREVVERDLEIGTLWAIEFNDDRFVEGQQGTLAHFGFTLVGSFDKSRP